MKGRMLSLPLVMAVMVAACVSRSAQRPHAMPAGLIAEFPLPAPCPNYYSPVPGLDRGCDPAGITRGPDGNIWFADYNSFAIGRVTPVGKMTEFPTHAGVAPVEITSGPDGSLWFTDYNRNTIGRITPAGKMTEFPIPPNCVRGVQKCEPFDISRGPDGNLWFTEPPWAIGRITPAGKITQFPSPGVFVSPSRIAAGPDGNLWFTDYPFNNIGRITPAGKITAFPLPNPNSKPADITAGPDGNLWFTECAYDSKGNCTNGQIGRISPDGKITQFSLPSRTSEPGDITAGPDGNLWFTASTCSYIGKYGAIKCKHGWIGRITPTGQITEFRLPDPNSSPVGITSGPDGNLWFTTSVCTQVASSNLGAGPLGANECIKSRIGRIASGK